MAVEDLYLSQPAWDLALDDAGKVLSVEGAARVVQAVRARLGTAQGEWPFDESMGVDWIGTVVRRGVDTIEARDAVAEQILATPGVARIVTLDLTISADRRLSVRFEVETDAGVLAGGTL